MKYLIGNLKMNGALSEFKPYLKGVDKLAKSSSNFVGLALPYPYLFLAEKHLKHVRYGAQNCHHKSKGAFTGEVSINMLKDFDCNLCLVGHSERRNYNSESNADVNNKLSALLESNITPILCFGETLEQRKNGKTKYIVKEQIKSALDGVNNLTKVIYAYEPVWAIGTGVTPTLKEISSMATYVKNLLEKLGANRDSIVLLYGGSINENNAREILALKDVDGGLIGGACLNVNTFSKIIACSN